MPKLKRKRYHFSEDYKQCNPLMNSCPNRTLKVIILDYLVEVTTHSLYYIFSYYGSVLRIVLFNKAGLKSALVEYDSVDAATRARNFLNEFNMFYSCNRLQIEYSWTTQLNVIRNDERKCWDYTKHVSDCTQAPAVYYTGVCDTDQQQNNQFQLNISSYQPQVIFSPIPLINELNVIIITGLQHESTNPHKVFNLLSIFGNVSKIQFIAGRPGSAVVQMFDQASAENCVAYLNYAPIGNEGYLSICYAPMNCQPSDYETFLMPDGSTNYHDFSGSKNQRFLVPRPQYWIQPLSKVIRYYNTPAQTSQGFIFNTFSSRTIAPKNVKVLLPDEDTRLSRGLVEFHTIGHAIIAIMDCNNLEIKNSSNRYFLKLCFSSSQSLDLKH